jgi:hypothetical protein
LAKYRQDFVGNSGLDNMLATLVFDAYLFGLDLKTNLQSEDYKSESHNPNLFLEELIVMALVDDKLEKSEIKNIFIRCEKQGLSEDDIFKQLVKTINQHNLQPLNALAEVKLRDKSILLQYDWVNEEIIKQEKLKQTSALNNGEREKARQAALQKDQALAIQKEKELELKKIELELKKKEQEAKEQEAKRVRELEKQKENQIKKKQNQENRKKLWLWLTTKRSEKEMSPALWVVVILFVSVVGFLAIRHNFSKDIQEEEAQEFSAELEKKYAIIENYILKGQIDSALVILPEIVHPSKEKSPYKSDGVFSDYYSYNEYWQIKRESLKSKIEAALKTEMNTNSIESFTEDLPNEEEFIFQDELSPWEEIGISEEEYHRMKEDGY